MVISWGRRGPSGERSEVDVKQNQKLSQRKCKIDTKQHKRWLISPTPWAVLHVKSEQVIQHILPNKIEEVKSLLIPAGKVIPVQSYSPIVSPKHINGISVRHNSVFTAPEYRRDMSMTIHSFTQRKLLLSGCYLAPTNSSQGGSLLHRWTVSNGPKLSVRYSTLSEQLWSKSTLGATLVDLQDMVAVWAASQCHSASTVDAIFYITIQSVSWYFK